jgi:hypothetical protein
MIILRAILMAIMAAILPALIGSAMAGSGMGGGMMLGSPIQMSPSIGIPGMSMVTYVLYVIGFSALWGAVMGFLGAIIYNLLSLMGISLHFDISKYLIAPSLKHPVPVDSGPKPGPGPPGPGPPGPPGGP